MSTDARIAAALAPEMAVIKRELQPKEQVYWIARPRAWSCAWGQARPRLLSAVSLAAFAAFWTYSLGTHKPENGLLYIVGALMFLGALAMLLSPIWYYLKARSTVYAVTDSRAMILTLFPGMMVVSHMPRDMGSLEKTVGRDGVGTLIFRREVKKETEDAKTVLHGFYGVPDVNGAEQQIRRIIGDAR